MNILLSAYACEPNRGSEPSVGWNWALEIEKLGHNVWVLTRKNNQQVIEDYWKENLKPENLNYIYYDVPKWLSWWKKGGRGVYLYYVIWQFGAFLKARWSHKIFCFEMVQHITFVAIRQPSFMGLLKIPFIFGPVGGGEKAPYKLRKDFPLKGKIKDFVRDVANYLVKFDPSMLLTFATADEIYVTSEQSKALLPNVFRSKATVQLAIGFDGEISEHVEVKDTLKLLYVGRFEYWKGMGLGIRAFAKVIDKHPNATLTMVGKGPDKQSWHALAKELSVADNITWIEWIEQSELKILYKSHDLFLFPSLHDSGGMVVLEAVSQGLPVVCLNLGGPGKIIDESCGIKINVEELNENQVIEELYRAIVNIYLDSNYRKTLSEESLAKARMMSWSAAVNNVYNGTTLK